MSKKSKTIEDKQNVLSKNFMPNFSKLHKPSTRTSLKLVMLN